MKYFACQWIEGWVEGWMDRWLKKYIYKLTLNVYI